MNTNEAPEKIYMTPSFEEPDNVLLASFSKSHLNFHRDVEYIRTDAFIKKVCEWLDENWTSFVNYDDEDGVVYYGNLTDKFKDYMKGKCSVRCNQTP